MNLTVVVSIQFLVKKFLGLSYSGDIFSDACPDEPVLKPLIGALNLTLGLGRQRIYYLDVTIS